MSDGVVKIGIWLAAILLVVGGCVLGLGHEEAMVVLREQPAESGAVMGEMLPSAVVILMGLILGVCALVFRSDVRKQKEAVLACGVLAFGWVVVDGVMGAAEDAERVERAAVAPLVEVLVVKSSDVEVEIEGFGTVEAVVRAEVSAQVPGRVVGLHANMVTGGFIRAGEVLLQIDREEYELAVEQARANMLQAESEQEVAKRRLEEVSARLDDVREVLDRTVELFERGVANDREVDKANVALTVTQAQLDGAKSGLASAEARGVSAGAALKLAELRLRRTEVTLPFDAVVVSERVDEGQYLNPGQMVGSVYGTEAVEIPIPLEDADLGWLERIPLAHLVSSGEVGVDELPGVKVLGTFGGKACEWEGKAVRLEGEVDVVTRMVTLVARVEGPLAEGKPALMPGAFTRVVVDGRTLHGVFELPRYALRDGREHGRGDGYVVYVVEEGVLLVRDVEVVRRAGDRVYVGEGLNDGAMVVLSLMDVVSEGMAVRTPGVKSGGASGVGAGIGEGASNE